MGLLIVYFPAIASSYELKAMRMINHNEPICFLLYVNNNNYVPTLEESYQYNNIEKKLLYDLSNLIFLYDLPFIINNEKKDCDNYNIILSFIFKYNNFAISASCCGYPYYSSLRLVVRPEEYSNKSSPLATLDYVLIWESLKDLGLTTSTDQLILYNLAREKMRSDIEQFALIYKRAKEQADNQTK